MVPLMLRGFFKGKGHAMNRLARISWTALLLGGTIVSTGGAVAADRTAEAILKDLESVQLPKLDAARRNDSTYIRDFITKRKESMDKRATLILELYKTSPKHKQIPTLMVERWASINSGPEVDDIIKEIDQVLAQTSDPKFKLEGTFAKAQKVLASSRSSGTPDLSAVDEFLKLAPKDPRGVGLLYGASYGAKKKETKTAIEDRIVRDFPDSMYAGMIKGSRHQLEAIGKPFDLDFTDAIKGSAVSIKGLKGKVVVIDFWATWCGPCVAEMPKMKELYAKYRDQGVEFIGVSLDQPKEQGGLDKLKTFVKQNEIGWPQYYQGKGWESEFSMSLGINSIPCVFIVDAEGKLYSVEAGGKLEEMIPDLLKKKTALLGGDVGGFDFGRD
jgi:thiol-disulfide isomerase/thioredoxin